VRQSLAKVTPASLWLAGKTAALQGAILVGMHTLPYARLQRLVNRAGRRRRPRRRQRPIENLLWAVQATSRPNPLTTCLSEALTAQVLLHRHGYPACVRIGVAKAQDGRLEAHAWLESGDQLVLGARGYERYSPLPALDEVPARRGVDTSKVPAMLRAQGEAKEDKA
jgi:transglutaminase superfamily protein